MSNIKPLLDKARQDTGLDDFGDDSFREGLEILMDSAGREAQLTPQGRGGFEFQVVDLLSNRLQVEYWYRQHPEIDEQEIVAPLIGLGLPRTGSTALSCLLAEDPNTRSIRNWEALSPCPPPETATQYNDPRISRAEAFMERRNTLFPRMKIMLPSTATSPTECQTFMGMDFKSQLFQAYLQIPSYVEWLNHEANLVPTYHYVKRILKLLQWRCPPNRWRLKNPSHSLFIDALHEVFPDARYWMTHRDVSSVIPSVADLYYELTKASAEHVDKHWIGRIASDFCEIGMRRMIAFREAGHDHRFFDIYFSSFMKDPYPDLEKLYAFLGEELTDETRRRMQAWRENSPRDKHGDHTYDATDFGLSSEQLQQRFAFYHDHFQLN